MCKTVIPGKINGMGKYGPFHRIVVPYGFVWKCWVYSQWNSHLIGIMISKTIGFRGTQHFQTHPYDTYDTYENLCILLSFCAFPQNCCSISSQFTPPEIVLWRSQNHHLSLAWVLLLPFIWFTATILRCRLSQGHYSSTLFWPSWIYGLNWSCDEKVKQHIVF